MVVSMSTDVSLKVHEEAVISTLQEAASNLDSAQGETVLDFSEVRRLDAAAVRALEELVQAAEDKAVKVVLTGVNVDVYKVLKLVKLTPKLSFVN